jgi:hypothetical protein
MRRIITGFLILCLTSLPSFGQGAQSGQTSPAESTDTSTSPGPESDPSGNPPAKAGDPNPASAPDPASAPNPAASTVGYVFPSNREIVRYGYGGVAGVRALAGSAFTASWNTWVDTSPREWHRDASGWGKRFGTSILDHAINQSALVGLSIAVHEDPMYYRCSCTGFWPRTGHALRSTYRARNRQGDYRFSFVRVGTPFLGPIITRNTIYPDRFNTGDGLESGALYIAGTAGWNMVREFLLKKSKK